ncbi:MAG: hypothetical protein RLZZ136_278 [Pseudomonadota bacterium]
MIKRFLLIGFLMTAAAALVLIVVLVWQGKRKPDTSGQYVALGSSFAAGIGLGPREPGSPLVCMRSTQGYPHLLSRLLDLSLVDMTCSGSTTQHILQGGQVFLGPQLAAIGANTRLVTITSGGNDAAYIGDLTLASGRAGLLGKLLWKGPKPLADRNFNKITSNLHAIAQAIRQQAPKATVVIVSYPTVLPDQGTCISLGISPAMADTGRQVAAKLLEATRLAAEQSGAIFVDMTAISAGHDACASEPWVNGANPKIGTPFHPNQAGAEATAAAIHQALTGKL